MKLKRTEPSNHPAYDDVIATFVPATGRPTHRLTARVYVVDEDVARVGAPMTLEYVAATVPDDEVSVSVAGEIFSNSPEVVQAEDDTLPEIVSVLLNVAVPP